MIIASSVPKVQRDVEGEPGVLPSEQPGRQREMGRAADRRKFGERLNDGEHDDLVKRHGLVMVTKPVKTALRLKISKGTASLTVAVRLRFSPLRTASVSDR